MLIFKRDKNFPLSLKTITDLENDVKVLSGNKTLTTIDGYKDIKSFDWSADEAFFYLNLNLVSFPAQGIATIAPTQATEITNGYYFEIKNQNNSIYKIISLRDPFETLSHWLPNQNRPAVYLDQKQIFFCDFPSILQNKLSIQCDKSFLPFSSNTNITARVFSIHKEKSDTFADCL